MAKSALTDEQLMEAYEAYREAYGNRSEGARLLGLKRQTFNDRLEAARERLGVAIGKVAGGSVEQTGLVKRSLPKKGHVKRYVFSCVQNNTFLHGGFHNLLAYVDWLDSLPKASCELILGRIEYNKNFWEGSKEDVWYAPEAVKYMTTENLLLAPGMVFAGQQNIIPTRKYPLSNKAELNGRLSNIIAHTKMHAESVPSMPDEATKINLTTGTVTLRNYIQKDAGIMAEQEHTYGALLLEVDHTGSWWWRHLEIGSKDEILDCGPSGYAAITVQAGQVDAVRERDITPQTSVTHAINWGDTHAVEMDRWVREACFGEDGILDSLMPAKQFHNDLLSFRSRSHHEMRDPIRMYEKHAEDEENVEEEVEVTAEVLAESDREWCETIVVPSNHDRHLDRWISEADWKRDPVNARFYLRCAEAILTAIDEGEKDFNAMEWALREKAQFGYVRFLSRNEGYVICKRKDFVGIECGLHGDEGANGAKGSTQSLIRLGRPINKGHDHILTRRGFVMSAGACAESFVYMNGPSAHSIAHILTYENGARTHIMMFNGKWRA